MRSLGHLVAVAGVLLFVLGLKFVVPAADADAFAVQTPTLNILQMHQDFPNIGKLPVQKINDMTFALD
jgi:hypothetical protein